MTYKVAQLEDIGEVQDGRCPFRPVRYHLGVMAFGVNGWTASAAGDRIINEHTQDDEEELYVVLRGRATFEIGEEMVDAPTGTLVFVSPDERRTAFAEEADTTILAIGAVAGEAYEPDGMELWAAVAPHYEAGDYDRAIEVLQPLAEQHPEYPTLLYNLACLESLTGRTADAVDHLRRSIERSERSRVLARDDPDFDPIRDEPSFNELLEEVPA
jgi:mannose-6-phosphate isomerase-like protein (cupin superfamily)